jgi:hypothetical protein
MRRFYKPLGEYAKTFGSESALAPPTAKPCSREQRLPHFAFSHIDGAAHMLSIPPIEMAGSQHNALLSELCDVTSITVYPDY